jgi:hypothetical protein
MSTKNEEIYENEENEEKINECKLCNYVSYKKYNYERHCLTPKHIKKCIINEKSIKINEKLSNNELLKFECIFCKNVYKERSGLWRHKKKCSMKKEIDISTEKVTQCFQETPQKYEELVMNLLTQNMELQKQVIELCKEKTMTINNTTNNNNQKFNMNFFLNEQCKGALDIMDFVNSLKVNLTDLENTGNVGYVKGISDIFLRGLRELDVYKRPIHCSDLKREVMYVKDNDVWEKDEDKKKVKKIIQNIAHKNFKQINEWVEVNPDSKDIQTKKHDQYMKILIKCCGGTDIAEDDIFYNKIISNVAKEVHIDK